MSETLQASRDQLIETIRDLVHHRLSRDSRVRDHEVSDLAQETLVALLKHLERLQSLPVGELRGFVFQAADRKVLDDHRSKTRKKRDPGTLLSLDAPGESGAAIEPAMESTTVSQLAMRRETDALIATFPPAEKEVLLLWRLGYNIAEITRELGIDRADALSRHMRGLKRLRRCLYQGAD